MASSKHEIFLPQIDVDVIKMEDTKPLAECMNEHLEDTLQDSRRKDDKQHFLVCAVCLCTVNIQPLPQTVRWLHNVTSINKACGVCSLCAHLLQQATKLVDCVKKAQIALDNCGEINKSSVDKLAKAIDYRPLVLMKTPVDQWSPKRHRRKQKNVTSTPKVKETLKPSFVEIKVENDIESSDTDLELDCPLKILKDKSLNEKKKNDKKVQIEIQDECDENGYDFDNDDINEENDAHNGDNDSVLMKDITLALKMDEIQGSKTKFLTELLSLMKKRTQREKEIPDRDALIDKYFNSKHLTLEEQRAENQSNRGGENANFKCDECDHGFATKKDFEIHIASHSKKSRDALTCNVCEKQCNTKMGFVKHLEAHLDAKAYYCKMCDFQTSRKTSARVHSGWHHGKRFECDKCGLVLKRQSNLLSHVRVRHPSAHVCSLCGFAFVGERGLRCHTLIVHKGEDYTISADAPRCEECDVSFKSLEALATHQRVSPQHGGSVSNQRPAKGSLLKPKGPEVRRRRGNRDPKNLRDNREVIRCEQCGEQLHSLRAYRVHANKRHAGATAHSAAGGHAPRAKLCHKCGMTFASPSALTEHARFAHSAEEIAEEGQGPAVREGRYRCGECGKAFQKAGSLATHKNIHLGRRFPCPICGKAFNQVCNRDRHYTYVHSTIRDVKCDYCEKLFKNIAEKKMHITYVHFKKPYKRNKKRGRDGVPGKRKREGDSAWMEGEQSDPTMP